MSVAPKDNISIPLFHALSLLTILLWASAFVGIRFAVRSYHPGSMALLRYLVASLCMGFVYYYQPHKTLPQKRDLWRIVIAGMLGIGLYNITLNIAEITVPAPIASFTISQSPVIATLLAMIFLGERLKPFHVAGILVSFGGVLLIALSHHNSTSVVAFQKGLLLVVIATFCGALYTVMQKPILKRLSAIQFVCYAIWSGTAVLLIYWPQLWVDIRTAARVPTLVVIYMGIFPAALAYLLWSYLLSKDSVARSAVVLYLIPLATMLLSWIFLNESITPLGFLGGLIALLGAYLVRRR